MDLQLYVKAVAAGDLLQGDHSPCAKPPIDFIAKVPFWPGLP